MERTSTTGTGSEAIPTTAGLYTRQATGLVRGISLSSAVYYNVTNIGLIFALLVITAVPTGFPNANPTLMALFTTIVCIPPALLYGMWTATLPRSGADYVWNGRTFHPWIGFAANFWAVAWFVLSNGYLAYLIGTDSLPTAFLMIGRAFNNSTITGWGATVSQNNWTFGLGVATLVICAAACALGLKRSLRILVALFFITIGGAIVAILIMAFHSHGDFRHAVQQFGGNYDSVVAAARRAGYTTGHYDSWTTLLAMPPLYLALGYSLASSYSGGELRQARRIGVLAPVVGMLIVGIIAIISFGVAANTLGFNFVGAATYLSNAGSTAYPFAHGSNYFFFVSMLTGSKILLVILALAYVCAPLATLIATNMYCTRAVFAWSFDRILPDWLSSVEARTRAPIPALLFVFALGFIYFIFIEINGTTALGVLGSIVIGSSFAFMLAALGAVILPYFRRSMFETSPFRRMTLLGIPVFSIVGALAFVVYLFMWIASLTQNAIGANTRQGLIGQAIVGGIGILIFPISYVLNRRRGVDLSLLGKVIPPE